MRYIFSLKIIRSYYIVLVHLLAPVFGDRTYYNILDLTLGPLSGTKPEKILLWDKYKLQISSVGLDLLYFNRLIILTPIRLG